MDDKLNNINDGGPVDGNRDLIWLAGVVDGQGHLYVNKYNTGVSSLVSGKLTITVNDKVVRDEVTRILVDNKIKVGTVNARRSSKLKQTRYTFNLTSKRATRLLNLLRVHMKNAILTEQSKTYSSVFDLADGRHRAYAKRLQGYMKWNQERNQQM